MFHLPTFKLIRKAARWTLHVFACLLFASGIAGSAAQAGVALSASQLVTNGDSTIAAANVLNHGGRINALGNAGITAGLLDNRGGAVAANGNLQLAVTTLDNRAGALDAANIGITATSMNNGGGIMRSAGDVTLQSGTTDNSGGGINAAHYLGLTSVNLANSGGTLVGDSGVSITTSSQSLGGTIASANDVTLNINGDYSNSGLLSSQRNLTLNATNISNSGTLTAGATLAANTGNLANSGEISGHDVQLNVTGTLANSDSGLIDGINTTVTAGIINNTGRIYGDLLRISSGTVNNSGTGVIAARDTLLLGVQNLNNTGGGLIYSLNDIGIGGAFDANGLLQGSVRNLLNASSRIEAGRNLALAATTVVNRNDGLTTQQVLVGTGYQEEVQSTNNATRYPSGLCSGIGGGQDDNSCIVHPDVYGQRTALAPVRTETCIDYGEGSINCTTQNNYAWNSPVFAQFQVAPVSAPPAEPYRVGGCTADMGEGSTAPLNSPECNQWRVDYATWDTAFNAAVDQLAVKLDAYNAEVNEDNRRDHFEDYTWFKLNSTTTTTQVATTAPGQILSGGAMNLTGSVTNQQSNIVAGGALTVVGPAVDNVVSHGVERTDYSGTTQFTHVDSCGTFGGSHCRRWDGVNPYNPAPLIITTDLANFVYAQNAGNTTTLRNLAIATASADTTAASAASQAGGNTRVPVVSVTANVGDANSVILSTQPALAVPTSKLFAVHAEPAARYLVETDPRFTSQRSFLSSDYFQQALQRDPERQLKRYGDGFTEQQLVNDQVLALTGRRFLSGYASTEQEYQALMDAGVAFTQKYQLTPGVALSADQMALLTTDVVLLTTRSVTLADGSTQDVLAPQVYLRRPTGGDLLPTGALMAGADVLIQTAGNLANSGTITGDTVTAVAGRDLVNQGRISGQSIWLRASNDLQNLSGVISGAGTNSNVSLLAGRDIVLQTQTLASVNSDGTSTRSSVQHIATVQGGTVQLAAGRDLVANGASVNASGDLTATAARDIRIGTAAGQYQLRVDDASGRSTQGRTAYLEEASTTNQSSAIRSGGNTILATAGDAHLTGAQIAGDNVQIQTQNVTIDAAADRTMADLQTVQRKAYNRALRDDETLVGSSINATNNLTVHAMGGDIALTGAYLAAQQGQVALVARDNVNIDNGVTHHRAIDESYSKSSGLFSSVATTKSSTSNISRVEGSIVSGNSVAVVAGHTQQGIGNVEVKGSSVVADSDVMIDAGNNLSVVAAQQASSNNVSQRIEKSGLFSSGGASITWGDQKTDQNQAQTGIANVASSIGSLGGNVTLGAGNRYVQTGSQVLALQGDINVAAKSIDINAAFDSISGTQQTKFEQSGLTLALSSPVISALQSIQQMGEAAGKTKDKRMQALALATAAKSGYDAVQSGADGNAISLSITVGSSQSESKQTQNVVTAAGSTLRAGGDLNLSAQGAGKDSSITVRGSELQAGHDATLAAEGAIDLGAAQSAAEQHSTNSSRSSGVGIAISFGQGGAAFGITANASAARGHSDGNDVINSNTHVNAGNRLTLDSGSDTTLKGAVASGKEVVARVGGNLNIESLQDTSVFDSKQESIGGSVTVGFGFSGSISGGQSKVNADYASVNEQSGIAAGDGGFTIDVKGNTDLKGGALASSQAAIDNNRNSLVTSTLTQSDIANHDHYSASSFSLGMSGSIGGGGGKDGDSGRDSTPTPHLQTFQTGMTGTSAGIGSASGDAAGTTKSGISGGRITVMDGGQQQAMTGKTAEQTVAGTNRDIVSGQGSGSVGKDWDGQQLQDDVQAQAQITAAFGQLAAKSIGSYADQKMKEARISGNTEDAANWAEGGAYRNALHAAVGALTGGVQGAAGAYASAAAMPALAEQIDKLDAPKEVKQALEQIAAAGLGGMVGGTAGAAAGLNVEANNRQLHIKNFERLREGCQSSSSTECQTINRMAGVRSGMPIDDASIPASKVVANYDANGNVVSYVLVDRKTNQPTMILEPLDYAAYRNASPGTQAMMQLSPQYALDFASAGLYASAGDNSRGVEHVIAGVTSRDYVRDVALGVAGVGMSAVSMAGKTSANGANSVELAATRASVDDKLARYLLNAEHPVGGPKAKWFDSALGFNPGNADQLAKQVVFNEASAVQTAVTEHGIKFNQVIPITGANGKVIDVTFGWIRNNDGIVRLTTAIPTKK